MWYITITQLTTVKFSITINHLTTDQLNAINPEDPESTYMTDDEEEIVENEETELCQIKLFWI